jgi:hypothetical protein
MVECQYSKTPDSSTRAIWQSYQQSSGSTQEELVKEMMNLILRNVFVYTRKSLLRAAKSYDMGPLVLLVLRRKACCGFLLPLNKFIVSATF